MMTRAKIHLSCCVCGRTASAVVDSDGGGAMEAIRAAIGTVWAGWMQAARGGDRLFFCPDCVARAGFDRPSAPGRAGFTLVELLVVILVIGVVAALAIPTAFNALADRRLASGAQLVQAALVSARDRAAGGALAGVRLEPDPGMPIPRLADGRIDPDKALIYTRIRPLADAGSYMDGSAAVSLVDPLSKRFPAGFNPPPGPLVLEESFWAGREGTRARNNPTSWFWNVRVGDRVEVGGAEYTVVGPTAWGVDRNPELFVNVGAPGTASPLDRGDGPLEFLYLVNGRDDDRDGLADEGFDGIDNDLDGLVDEADEWEVEAWSGAIPRGEYSWDVRYAITRRPIPASTGAVDLPAGIVIDATGWAEAAKDRPRSRLPVDPWTGAVELRIDRFGGVESRGIYSTPAAAGFGPPWLHFWVTDVGEVRDQADPSAKPGRLVSIQTSSGAIAAGTADPADPAGSVRRTQDGGGR